MADPRQLDLFAPEPHDRPAEHRAPTDRDPFERQRALAAELPRHVRFGTSSWTFPGWAGLVYQRSYPDRRTFTRESLAEYARHPLFRTVGVDRSYYAPIAADELADYAEQLPEGFPCAMKVWSEITTFVFPRHERYGERAGRPNPSFLDAELFREAVATPVLAAFAAHAGPMVLEIPPPPGRLDVRGFERSVERFLESAPPSLRYAFELRDPRLFTDRYLSVLRAHGATHVLNFWSRMPGVGAQLDRVIPFDLPFAVARLLLPRGKRYDELKRAFSPFDRLVAPQPEMRRDVLRLCEWAVASERDVFVLVNNKAEGSAPLTIEALAEGLVAART
jgi:uncharacterized protein YecE (DUF72 family)